MPPSGMECYPVKRSATVSSKPAPGCPASGPFDEPQRPGLVPESAGELIPRLPANLVRSDLSQTSLEEVFARKQIVFLVGGPRSGTTWLQLLLSRSPRIATANETHLFTGYTRSLFSAWNQHQRNVRELGLHHLRLIRHLLPPARDNPSALDRLSRPTSRASARSLGRQRVRSRAPRHRAADRRCVMRRLRARPPPEPDQARCHFYVARPVTFQPCADICRAARRRQKPRDVDRRG